ncbi:sensor histidine kinase [Sphingomonas sanxanigenens]|uniref:histidine kinase n=1 Tax=Sphingomonas sanxanigenens DSM 19645 = NX02 TaxID=1123269 RepID=W0ADN3_9SPHN|nr:ATP-binding protein [Sphingomonas sanxanigenens]AHE53795.1 hypothetical protein NX02_10390 [Sphingomonas sanxanigenens DSM 19645 = NX02]
MNAARSASTGLTRLRRKVAILLGRRRLMPAVEVIALVLAVAIGVASYFIIGGERSPQKLLTPPLVALLLVANLVPAIALLVLLGRRVAHGRAARSPIGGNGRLHVRLVALFSVIAAVPTLLVVIFASLLFQYGVEFWFSDRARGMLENASELVQGYYQEQRSQVAAETQTMASDLRDYLGQAPYDSPDFIGGYAFQMATRHLNESAIVSIGANGQPVTLAMVNPDARDVEQRVSSAVVGTLRAGKPVVISETKDRVEAVARLFPDRDIYLYASRRYDAEVLARASGVLRDYNALLDRSRALQLQFNAALLVISLLIVGAAVWIALQVADRLVRPVGELVDAARRVAAGELSARVASPRTQDEVGTLATAFNRMTRRLEEQTGALVAANDQLDSRRAFIEAVLSSVSAGVISVDKARVISLINLTAATFLRTGGESPVGQPLASVAPELDALIDCGERESIVQLTSGGEQRTLAVKVVHDEQGHVLTFDDITQQLLDQRRAAWSDVARRIAHEIKNPLTPIQLAAERLRRRYAKEIQSDKPTFERLTDTIVRQVGDLRRMVDEFSSFARMPKPVFRVEALIDIARQALFLHEVAHPTVRFTLDAPDPSIEIVSDRRQLGQALTNIVKNAVEAIESRGDVAGDPGFVAMTVELLPDGLIRIAVADNGIGLPAERDRLVEPYMTTRARGTGLGLAIVKKIVEEHCGTIAFGDRPGGGTVVTILLDPAMLANLDLGDAPASAANDGDASPMTLTRIRND